MRTRLTQEQKLQLWRTQIGLDEESSCPGCLVVRMYRKKPTTWQVCHIQACSRGGTMQLYNLFLMCKVCNDAQGTQNLFSYLYLRNNIRGLKSLMVHVANVLKHQYDEMWLECQKMLHVVALQLFIVADGDVAATGKLHPRDPVLREFLIYDRECTEREISILEGRLKSARDRLLLCLANQGRVDGLPELTSRIPATPQQHRSLGLK